MAFLLFTLGCDSQEDITTNRENSADLPDQEGWRSVLTTTSDGEIRATFKYEHMAKYSGKNLTRFDQGVEIELYDENGEHTSTVHADVAVMTGEGKHVDLAGNVKVESDNGITLFSEKLQWNESTGTILSEEFVTVVTAEDDTLYGVGFESEQSLENWLIKQPRGVTQKRLRIDALEDAKEKNSDE